MAGNVDWGITGTLRMIKLLRETSRKIKISELKRKASEVEDECPRVGGGGGAGTGGKGQAAKPVQRGGQCHRGKAAKGEQKGEAGESRRGMAQDAVGRLQVRRRGRGAKEQDIPGPGKCRGLRGAGGGCEWSERARRRPSGRGENCRRARRTGAGFGRAPLFSNRAEGCKLASAG